jgi:hypothetical protein
MTYERITAVPVREVLRLAEEILKERIPVETVRADGHSITLAGGDGTAVIEAHRHGVDTVVHVETDQLGTSRLDGEVQFFLTLLPYQPGDAKGRAADLPGGLSRAATLGARGALPPRSA